MKRFPVFLILFCGFLSAGVLAQSGRVKSKESPTPTPQKPPSRVVYSPTETVLPFPNQKPAQTATTEDDDVIKVDSALVPIPVSVLNAGGQAVTNLRLEDFELFVDGQRAEIGEISRSETPVRLALLFDNSSSVTIAREFEKKLLSDFSSALFVPIKIWLRSTAFRPSRGSSRI